MNDASKSCHAHSSPKACVAKVPIFSHLTAEQMDEIMETVNTISFKKGETLFQAGDSSDTLYIIHQGSVKIYRHAESGKEQILNILKPGDFTGEYAVFNKSIHQDYAEALAPAQVCMIHKDDLQRLLTKYPTISLKMLTEFSKRLEASESQTTHFATEKADTRIAQYLLKLSEEAGKRTFNLPMSRTNLAAYLGTSPETISRRLTQFEEEGIIQQLSRSKIEIIDEERLQGI